MNNKIENSLNSFCTLKYLVLILVIISSSCEKENNKQIYSFQRYYFVDNINCYNAAGNKSDSLTYMYSKNDFIYSDTFALPYDKIEIDADGTMRRYYTVNNKKSIENGRVTLKNDSSYFYATDSGSNDFLFSGLINGNQLRIPGYGYIYHIFSTNGFLSLIQENKAITLGFPDYENLIKKIPSPALSNYIKSNRNMYLQRFDLIYEKN